jgi:Domain of Unknown Function (DUF1080)
MQRDAALWGRCWSTRDLISHFRGKCLDFLAQQTAQPYVPKQSDRPELIEGDEAGFVSMFDGKTLAGWEGDLKYWRVSDGIMTGEITPETIIKSNTFIIWHGATPEDFELKVNYRITSVGNSGINYRSVVVPDKVTPANKFAMRATSAISTARTNIPGITTRRRGVCSWRSVGTWRM